MAGEEVYSLNFNFSPGEHHFRNQSAQEGHISTALRRPLPMYGKKVSRPWSKVLRRMRGFLEVKEGKCYSQRLIKGPPHAHECRVRQNRHLSPSGIASSTTQDKSTRQHHASR